MRKTSLLIAALVLAVLMMGSMAIAQEGQPDSSEAATEAGEVETSSEQPAEETTAPSEDATASGSEQDPATADDQAEQPAEETDTGEATEQPAEETATGEATEQPAEETATGEATEQPAEETATGEATEQSAEETATGEAAEQPAETSGDTTGQSETPEETEPSGDTTSQSETAGEAEPSGDDAPAKEEEVAEEKPEDPTAPYLSVTFAEGEKPRIIMETSMGNMVIELWPDLAPKHCQSFVYLTEKGFFDSLTFHRIVPRFVIQGGCPDGNGMGGPGYSVPAEFNPTLHEDGILSMARSSDPNSAGSQFFICLGRLTSLDNKYTVFGKVVEGLEIAHKIEAVPTKAEKPNTPVVMTKVFVEKSD